MTETIDKTKRPRDWFGYILTTFAGIAIAITVAWYQLYATERDAAAAETERVRSVRQVAVAIVEEHVLNGKKLEGDRLARLIDQRRRDESISVPIPVDEIVELAEFSISSSRHLSVERKEEMKPIFDAFYLEQKARTFVPAEGQLPSTQLLNEVAKWIQQGRSNDALEALTRLETAQRAELMEASRRARPTLLEAVGQIVKSPSKMAIFAVFTVAYFWLASRVIRGMRTRRKRSLFTSQ